MKGDEAAKLYDFCVDVVGDEKADELYNVLEGYTLQFLDEQDEEL